MPKNTNKYKTNPNANIKQTQTEIGKKLCFGMFGRSVLDTGLCMTKNTTQIQIQIQMQTQNEKQKYKN